MKMKISKLFPKKKLRASVAARRSLRASAEAYDDMDEPNMKLSRALLIVLILHVVAVSGIVAFNAIKTRQDSFVKPASAKRPPRGVFAGANRTERGKCRGSPENIIDLGKGKTGDAFVADRAGGKASGFGKDLCGRERR